MNYNFDTIIDRWGSDCEKYDTITKNGYPEDMIPMWVADMDFSIPECMKEELHKIVDRGIFGYSLVGDRYYTAVENWFSRRYGWNVNRNWIVQTPGVVTAISAAIRTCTNPGDGVLIQSPVYHHFFHAVERNGRNVVENPLKYENGQYLMDFDDMERKIKTHNIKLMLLCSPHNPVCRVWSQEELRRLGEICSLYGVTVLSDEIYCDFFSPGYHHTPIATVCPDIVDNLIICTSPSKSFNLAGLQFSNIFIPGAKLREKFRAEMGRVGYNNCNYCGMQACTVAYEKGEEWLEACKEYIWGNVEYIQSFVREKLPMIHVVEPQGTYLMWLDLGGLGLSEKEIEDLMFNKARVWPDMGAQFGEKTGQFIRLALACPRSVVVEVMERLEKAINECSKR